MAAFITSRDTGLSNPMVDPMDLIRYEVLRNLGNWLSRLLLQKEYNRLSWIEFGWSAHQLNSRYPLWSFLRKGEDILEAAKDKDEERVMLHAHTMQEILIQEQNRLDNNNSVNSVA